MTDSTSAIRQLKTLDFVEKLGDSDIPSCAGCMFYWEDPLSGVLAWGFCRRRPPEGNASVHQAEQNIEMGIRPYDLPSVDYNWYCGEFHPGPHKLVTVQRLKWRQELEQARDASAKSGA